MYCEKCQRWIDTHEEEARETGQCADEAKCEARAADPGFPGYHTGSLASLSR